MDDRQVSVGGVLVDEGLAVLLGKLWAAGYQTVASCQERSVGIGYIHFGNHESARRFAQATGLPDSNGVVEIPTSRIAELETVKWGDPQNLSVWGSLAARGGSWGGHVRATFYA